MLSQKWLPTDRHCTDNFSVSWDGPYYIRARTKKKAERQAAKKAETRTDLPDVSEVDINSDFDTDEEDNPGKVRKASMDPEIFNIKRIKYTDQDILTSLDKAKAAKECIAQVTTLYGPFSADSRLL